MLEGQAMLPRLVTSKESWSEWQRSYDCQMMAQYLQTSLNWKMGHIVFLMRCIEYAYKAEKSLTAGEHMYGCICFMPCRIMQRCLLRNANSYADLATRRVAAVQEWEAELRANEQAEEGLRAEEQAEEGLQAAPQSSGSAATRDDEQHGDDDHDADDQHGGDDELDDGMGITKKKKPKR